MSFLQLAKQRYSVRAYKPDPIPDELLNQVLEAARLAPSAANRQPLRLIVMRTAGREAELRRIYDRHWFVQGPLVIAAVAVPAEGWVGEHGRNYTEVDVAIAMDHLTLAAADLGLGSCWIGAFNADAARAVLALPPAVHPVAFTPLGYPADAPGLKERRPLADLVRWERWS